MTYVAEAMGGEALPPFGIRKPGRLVSRGIKLMLIALLALSMSLLALFVDSISAERRGNAERARPEVSAQITGPYVSLVPTYRSVERSLKYAPLFLGLVFLTYFLFEVASGLPMHVAQYVLVGVAQLIFYLLLLSFAEKIGFDWGFLLGGGATIALLATNVGWVFRSSRLRWRAVWAIGGVYAMIYGLLRLENNALLLGSLCSFGAIATAMYMTRHIDWYGGPSTEGDPVAGRAR